MSKCRKQNAGHIHDIEIDNKITESMDKIKYLGTTLTNQNVIHEEIKSQLNSGNAFYYCAESFVFQYAIQEYKD
jgi:hypothetical protein